MKPIYNITRKTIEKVLDTLENYLFSEDGEYNNDDVFEALDALKDEIEPEWSKVDRPT